MRDSYFFMCTTPCHEKCVQLGDDNYQRDSRLEASAFIGQLERNYGEPPSGSDFAVVQCPHDFGVYLDVRLAFDESVEDHMAYLRRVQESVGYWDQPATAQLTQKGYGLMPPTLVNSDKVE